MGIPVWYASSSLEVKQAWDPRLRDSVSCLATVQSHRRPDSPSGVHACGVSGGRSTLGCLRCIL